MNHINITSADIVKGMSDESKHNFANYCIANKIEPEDGIKLIKNVANATINFAIGICNNYFESPAGKEYLNMRRKIENIGQKY